MFERIKTIYNGKKNERTYKKSGLKSRFSFDEFLCYRMQEMTPQQRNEILTVEELEDFERKCNQDEKRPIFNDKRIFHQYFGSFVHREIRLFEEMTFEEYKNFLEKHQKIFVKPPCGYAGQGALVVTLEALSEEDNLREDFLRKQKEGYLAEEYVLQDERYAKVYDGSLNTVRLCTMMTREGTPFVFAATNQFGSEGSVVDNDNVTGIWAVIDVESGVVTDAEINAESGIVTEFHPNSGAAILGFQNPKFQEMKELVLTAARVVPQCRLLGWDVCLTRNGDIELIEGNVTPELDLFQYITKRGFRSFFEKYV
ncbi:MAG: hypothetical protein MJ105_00715 [Lachnospiraceae bacterium]|nr:hypothetical protein [Lachnospiraceae bacterium]